MLTIEGNVGPGAHLIVTAQSATRVYGPGRARSAARWRVGPEGTLELRGEPLLLFGGAQYHARLEVELAEGARLLLSECVAFVEFAPASAELTTLVRRNGVLALRDVLQLTPGSLDGGCVGTLAWCDHRSDPAQALAVQRTLGDRAGVGTPRGGGIFVRALAPTVWAVREVLDEGRAAFSSTAFRSGS